MNYNLVLYGEMNPSQQLKHLRHLNVLIDPLNQLENCMKVSYKLM